MKAGRKGKLFCLCGVFVTPQFLPLGQWLSQGGPMTASAHVTWVLARNSHSQAPLQSPESEAGHRESVLSPAFRVVLMLEKFENHCPGQSSGSSGHFP